MNIIITGASRGIGYELVKLFAENSENRIIALSRNAAKLKKLQAESTHANISILPIDISNEEQVKNEFQKALSGLKKVDILINNAGAIVNKPFNELQKPDWEKVYTVNVFAPFMLIQQALPFMGFSNKSHIVNISSMGGFQGSVKFAGLSAYSSSKAAIACLTECLAEELKGSNIAVNCLAIGAVQTEMLEEAFPGYKAPLSPVQMAGFIKDFALNGSNYFNGKILPVSLSTP